MLDYAILRLLSDGADHGYRLKQRLERMLEPVWSVHAGQIYRGLDRLRRQGWVDELPPEAGAKSGHERWPVSITKRGRVALKRWADEPLVPARPPATTRHEIVGRLRILGGAARTAILEGLERERVEHEDARARVKRLLKERRGGRDGRVVAERLALEAARLQIEAHLAWLDLCATEIGDRPEVDPASNDGRARTRPSSSR